MSRGATSELGGLIRGMASRRGQGGAGDVPKEVEPRASVGTMGVVSDYSSVARDVLDQVGDRLTPETRGRFESAMRGGPAEPVEPLRGGRGGGEVGGKKDVVEVRLPSGEFLDASVRDVPVEGEDVRQMYRPAHEQRMAGYSNVREKIAGVRLELTPEQMKGMVGKYVEVPVAGGWSRKTYLFERGNGGIVAKEVQVAAGEDYIRFEDLPLAEVTRRDLYGQQVGEKK